jgi:hypothetical protein
MHRSPIIVPAILLLLVACLLVAGCSDSGSTDQTAQPGDTSAAPTTGGVLFTAGDVVKSPSASTDVAWLVIGYDPATDMYERALIYPNAGGSWGYRADTRTEKTSRSLMEKVYTEKVATVDPSSVLVVTPTTVATEVTPSATQTAAATATTEAPRAPVITKIIPDKGYAGTTVTISDLVGNNFEYGANVTLSRSGSAAITATDVRVLSNKSILCQFAIPANAVAGSWDVTVTNLDGRSSTFTNIFSVNRDLSMVTTTLSVSTGTIPITNIDPPVAHVGNNEFAITGSNFQNGATVKLQYSGKPDIEARDTIWNSNTSIRCFITIPVGSFGTWDLVVTNPDSSYGRLINGMSIV